MRSWGPIAVPPADAPTVTVVLCTRDGARHIEAQLTSIVRQLRPPTELVIRDDASVDDTVAIVRRVLADSPFRTTIVSNPTPLGPRANFEAGIATATSDVIVLADQDDEWE